MNSTEAEPWGRVAEDGTVYVREADGERSVGEYPDGTPEEALAYYQRKYADLAGQVTLLEQRIKSGASASDVSKSLRTLGEQLVAPNAVGDIDSLRARLAALGGTVQDLTAEQAKQTQADLELAIAARAAIVDEMEALAAQDPARIQWKKTSADMDALFARWQQHQKDGPRLPKATADDLWKRFRTARTLLETARKAFFADLDSTHKDARTRKESLVGQAEALAPRGPDGIPAYRDLLNDWKAAGRAGKRQDDALWARFKAAGDVLFQAKSESDAVVDQEYGENLEAKLALLEGAAPILAETDRVKARSALGTLQRQWDAIGRVPRDRLREVEDRMRKIEDHVRQLDEDFWRRNNPETKARSEGLAGQLEDAIAKLEQELSAATASGDPKAISDATEALEARRSWLRAIDRG